MVWALYNILIQLFILSIRVHSVFNNKSKKTILGRNTLLKIPPKKKNRILVHCASLGEFEQARSVIEILVKEDNEIILSFFSPSGYEIQKDYNLASEVIYLPFDTPSNAKNLIKIVNPDLVIFVKYEFWWNHLSALIQSKIPIIYISASFRKDQYFFKSFLKPFRDVLHKINHFFVIDKFSADTLSNFSIPNYTIAGDTRAESIFNRKENHLKLQSIKDFIGLVPTIIFASTYPVMHDWLCKNASKEFGQFKLLIFPHDIHEKENQKMLHAFGNSAILYSNLDLETDINNQKNILIVDKIGLLADAYQYAKIAYIGGGFNNGIHNILEPFVYKIPLIYGPKYEKFYEAKYLSKKSFVKAISSIGDVTDSIHFLLNNKDENEINESHKHLFNQSIYPSQKIIEYLHMNNLING